MRDILEEDRRALERRRSRRLAEIDALHQAVLDQQRPVQQPHGPEVRAATAADRFRRRRSRRRLPAPVPARSRRNHRGADRSLRADVLRPGRRSDGHLQDARRRPRHPRSPARTTSTTASRWPISSGVVGTYPLNSRLVKQDGRIVEQVYRVGGLYDAEIRNRQPSRGCAAVRAGVVRGRASRVDPLVSRPARRADREAFDIAWVQSRDSAVDTMNGFIEVYMDARGMKGAWEGVVFYVNHEKTEKIRRLADQRAVVRGSPAGGRVPQAGGAGDLGACDRGCLRDRRLRPGDADRREPAERSADPRAATAASPSRCRTSSTPTSSRRSTASARSSRGTPTSSSARKKWGAFASELTTDIHEVLGHGSGRMAEGLNGQPQELLKEQYSALEESRADLVALYYVADPHW